MRAASAALLGVFFAGVLCAHESPVDHVERELRLRVEGGRLLLTYRVEQAERSLLMEFHQMDTDSDGVISAQESERFFAAQALKLAAGLELDLEGKPLSFVPAG